VNRSTNCAAYLTLFSIRLPSCAPVSRGRQGQALRVLRSLDPAGRGRMIKTAGSEGMPPFYPTKGINRSSLTKPLPYRRTQYLNYDPQI